MNQDLAQRYLNRLAVDGADAEALTRQARAHPSFGSASLLSRPVFLTGHDRAGLAADLNALLALLGSLPDRFFSGDISALARAVGMSPGQSAAVARAHAGRLVPLARADLYRDAEGFKLLEINITSAVGGFDNAALNRAMLDHPTLAGFVAAERLEYVDSLRAIIATMLAACPAAATVRRPVVALTDWPASFRTYEPRLRILADLMAEAGVDAVPCHVGQLQERNGRLEVAGRTVDIVYRFFLVEEFADSSDVALVDPVLKAVERGAVELFCGLDSELFGNKSVLALLSDDRYRADFSRSETDLIDRFLPWTRQFSGTGTTPEGLSVDLHAYSAEHRQDLVLKPCLAHGGTDVITGWTVGQAEWEARLNQASDGPFIIQRRVRPTGEAFPRPDGPGTQDHYLNWGVFVVDSEATDSDGYGGCVVQGSTDPWVGVIPGAPDVAIGCCFHQP